MKLQIRYERVKALVPYARNTRKHDAKNIGEIARVIERYGFLDPVAVDTNGVIVWGHGRVLAAELLGMETVPVIHLPPNLSDAEIKALRIAHNKLAEKSGWDFDALRLEFADLQASDFGLSDTAFDTGELDGLLRDFDADFASYSPPTQSGPRPSATAASFVPDESGDEASDEMPADLEEQPDGDGERPPKISDDEYSQFSLVMRHDTKTRLVNALDKIRKAKGLDKLEDALLALVLFYEGFERGE